MNLYQNLAMTGALLFSLEAFASPIDDWQGKWEGSCEVLRPGAEPRPGIRRTLEIKRISNSRFMWKANFGGALKDYELVIVDESRGHYKLDEKPGIIDTYLAGDNLYSHFAIRGAQLTSIAARDGDKLVEEFVTFGARFLDHLIPSIALLF